MNTMPELRLCWLNRSALGDLLGKMALSIVGAAVYDGLVGQGGPERWANVAHSGRKGRTHLSLSEVTTNSSAERASGGGSCSEVLSAVEPTHVKVLPITNAVATNIGVSGHRTVGGADD